MMAPKSRVVDRLVIASPCPVSWESMQGNQSVRFCQQCKLNVYNISEMSSAEAEKVIVETEGRLCARIFRRADGTIITQDCPVGLRWIRRKYRLAVAFLGCLFSWIGATCRGESQELRLVSDFDRPRSGIQVVSGGTGMSEDILETTFKKVPSTNAHLKYGVRVAQEVLPRLELNLPNNEAEFEKKYVEFLSDSPKTLHHGNRRTIQLQSSLNFRKTQQTNSEKDYLARRLNIAVPFGAFNEVNYKGLRLDFSGKPNIGSQNSEAETCEQNDVVILRNSR